MIDEPLFSSSEASTFLRRSKTTLRTYLKDGKICSTTTTVTGSRFWSIADLLVAYRTIYQRPASAEYVASFLYDKGFKDEVVMKAILTKLNLRELVYSWTPG